RAHSERGGRQPPGSGRAFSHSYEPGGGRRPYYPVAGDAHRASRAGVRLPSRQPTRKLATAPLFMPSELPQELRPLSSPQAPPVPCAALSRRAYPERIARRAAAFEFTSGTAGPLLGTPHPSPPKPFATSPLARP